MGPAGVCVLSHHNRRLFTRSSSSAASLSIPFDDDSAAARRFLCEQFDNIRHNCCTRRNPPLMKPASATRRAVKMQLLWISWIGPNFVKPKILRLLENTTIISVQAKHLRRTGAKKREAPSDCLDEQTKASRRSVHRRHTNDAARSASAAF